MSPLAAVALAREQGVRTVVHISCRDRNRLALQSQVVGAAALGSDGVLCIYGDPVELLGQSARRVDEAVVGGSLELCCHILGDRLGVAGEDARRPQPD